MIIKKKEIKKKAILEEISDDSDDNIESILKNSKNREKETATKKKLNLHLFKIKYE